MLSTVTWGAGRLGAALAAERPDDGRGLYKAYLRGRGGSVYCRGNSWPMYSTGKAVPPEAT